MDERQLLKDCLEGNVQAQKRLYELYARKMFGVCLRYASDQSMAEDFLQEGLYGFIQNWGVLNSRVLLKDGFAG
jgi:DNA-directed RNA polymerase specialized sigma24 family protein